MGMNNISVRRRNVGERRSDYAKYLNGIANRKTPRKKTAIKKEKKSVIIGRAFTIVGVTDLFLGLFGFVIMDNYGAVLSQYAPIAYVAVGNIVVGLIALASGR